MTRLSKLEKALNDNDALSDDRRRAMLDRIKTQREAVQKRVVDGWQKLNK
jgi:hypothetical protein